MLVLGFIIIHWFSPAMLQMAHAHPTLRKGQTIYHSLSSIFCYCPSACYSLTYYKGCPGDIINDFRTTETLKIFCGGLKAHVLSKRTLNL